MQSICRALALFVCLLGAASATEQSHRDAGRTYAASGDWVRAEEHLRRHIQAAPGDAAAIVLHSEALVHLNQPFDAVIELEQLLASAPDAVEALNLYGALLIDVMDEPARAEETFRKATALAPRDWQAWEGLGKLLLGRRKQEEAVQCLRTAAGLAPSNAEVASELARAVEDLEDASEAEAQHRRAVRLNDSLPRALPGVYVRFATFLAERDRGTEALAFFDKAVALDPRSADALYGRAAGRERLGKLREAEADALAALRQAPGRRDVRQLLIRVYRALGEPAKVDEQVTAIKRLAETEQAELARFRQMRTALNSGERLLAEGKFREAVAPYEKVVELVPTFYEAWFALGVSYSQAGESAKAEAALRRYLEFQPLSADGHSALGLLLLAAKRNSEARPELARALELNPELEEPRTALAKLALDGREYRTALSLIEPSLTRQTPDEDAYFIAASARFQLGMTEDAFSLCEQGLARHAGSAKLETLHTSFLLDCGRKEACKLRAARWWAAHRDSPRYERLMAELLVLNRPRDVETEDIVRKIVAASPSDASAHYLLAKWARGRNEHEMARDEAMKAAAMPGADDRLRMQCWTVVGMAEEALSDYGAAESAFGRAWELNRSLQPPSAAMAMYHVNFLLSGGRYRDAEARAREVLQWDPRHGPAHLALARVLENADRRNEAIQEAELSLQYMDEDGDPQQLRTAHMLLAKAYFAVGRAKEANVHQAWIKAH